MRATISTNPLYIGCVLLIVRQLLRLNDFALFN